MENNKERKIDVELYNNVIYQLLQTLAEVNTEILREIRDLATSDRRAAIDLAQRRINALFPLTGEGKCGPGRIWDPVSGQCIVPMDEK